MKSSLQGRRDQNLGDLSSTDRANLARYSIVESPEVNQKTRFVKQMEDLVLSNITSSMSAESKLL